MSIAESESEEPGASLRADDPTISRHSFPQPNSVEGHLKEMVSAISAVTRASLEAILKGVPASWPVSDEELETLGWFLMKRRKGVLTRLRASA